MDIFEGDPLGKFRVTGKGFQEIGNRIADLRLPTLIVMEGGYNNSALGGNTAAFLEPFTNGSY